MYQAYVITTDLRVYLVIGGKTAGNSLYVVGGQYPFNDSVRVAKLGKNASASLQVRRMLGTTDKSWCLPADAPVHVESAHSADDLWVRVDRLLPKSLSDDDRETLAIKVGSILVNGWAPSMLKAASDDKAALVRITKMKENARLDVALRELPESLATSVV